MSIEQMIVKLHYVACNGCDRETDVHLEKQHAEDEAARLGFKKWMCRGGFALHLCQGCSADPQAEGMIARLAAERRASAADR